MVPLSIMFIVGSVLLGAGALLAPALPGAVARIGLGAALTLALVLCGALAWTMLFGWDTLIIDYLLFALVTAVLLGGTLGRGHLARARGDADAGDDDLAWPGRTELALFALAAALFALPVMLLPAPPDTDAQGFGYLALMTRLAGSLDSLAPFHPEIDYLYAPGFSALVAWLSEKLGHPLHQVMFAFAAVLGLINVWLAHDLGEDLGGRQLGRAVALAMGGGLGLYLAFLDSHFTTLLALVFAQGFVLCALRYQRHGERMDLACAGLSLAAVVLSHPDTTIILALGFGPWLLSMWAGEPRPALRRWLLLLAGAPLLALLLVKLGLLRLIAPPLAAVEALSPPVSDRFLQASDLRFVPAHGERRHSVAFITGCIMSVSFAEAHRASLRVLARNGCDVHIPEHQSCCGALHVHGGDRETARELARRNIDAFDSAEYEAIIINSAGCGSTLKEYGELLADDPGYAERAHAFTERVRDLSEFLAAIGAEAPAGSVRERVIYQDACHLVHAQGVSQQPRDLLAAVPGVELVEMENPTVCCGAAGLYSVTDTEISLAILEERLDAIEATGAKVIVSANPGCLLHIQSGARRRGLDLTVMHVAEFLDKAYAA